MINFEMPAIQSIVMGVDIGGSHIYLVDNHGTSCQDFAGFAAIGSGYWHANSYLMFAGHVKTKPLPETLLNVYSAKKRSEVSPGVGRNTDMVMIAPDTSTGGHWQVIYPHVIQQLEEIYQDVRGQELQIEIKAREKVAKYVEEIARTIPTQEEKSAENNSGNPSVD